MFLDHLVGTLLLDLRKDLRDVKIDTTLGQSRSSITV